MGLVIDAVGLAKSFRSRGGWQQLRRGRLFGRGVPVLRELDLEVRRGEIVSLTGNNGSGKSTLLRVLAGLLRADAGTLRVLGLDPEGAHRQLRARVCYVLAEERSFTWRQTGRQNLEFFAALHGLGPRAGRTRAAQALEVVALGDAADRMVMEYSTGMRARLAVARGLLSDAELWLFDEPTRALDREGAATIRRYIRDELVSRRGGSVVLATHDQSEVVDFGGRALHLSDGRLETTAAPTGAA